MSNKDFKRKALSDDALKNVSGGEKWEKNANLSVDEDGYYIIDSSDFGRYRIHNSNTLDSFLSLLNEIYSYPPGTSRDWIINYRINDLNNYSKYKIQNK